MIEVIEGPTPNGGVRSEATFWDENRNPVDKESASIVIIKEYDEFGVNIMTTEMTKE